MMKRTKLIALSVLGLLLLAGVALTIYFMVFKKKRGIEKMTTEQLPKYKTSDLTGIYGVIDENNKCISERRAHLIPIDERSLNVGGYVHKFYKTNPAVENYGESDLYRNISGAEVFIWGRGVFGKDYSISFGAENKPALGLC
jgi:hypothetical protein